MSTDAAKVVPRGRRIAYWIAVVVGIGLALVGLGELIVLAVLGWLDAATLDGMYPGAAMHRLHVLAQAAIAWLIAIGIVIQPWRSAGTFAAAVVALTALVAYTGAAAVGGVFDPLAIIGVIAIGVIVWAHPGRTSARLLRFDRRRLVLGAALIAGSAALAVQQLAVQLSAASGEPHAAIGHYGFTAAMAIGVAASGAIGATSLPGRTLAGWLAVAGTVYYGLASMVFPGEASSLGVAGGAVAVAVAGLYAVGVVTSGRTAPEPATPDPRAQPVN
jgi:hypothetical protein